MFCHGTTMRTTAKKHILLYLIYIPLAVYNYENYLKNITHIFPTPFHFSPRISFLQNFRKGFFIQNYGRILNLANPATDL